ncbi:shieldin complex subunit 1 isoform X2 [Diceros bicornis minor]|uniref:shieldin complex subunit 1 isoform X2 n=1 Tax=Diceros bicornis minor TaxID=77932 RepID=UPI0026F2124D|nr:shieldin complex subunit 1 isoform X2 [Diceros bicornis minor]
MAAQDATPGSQPEESNALDLPSTCDIRDYVLQRPGQEPNSEAFSSVEAFSTPCSSEVDPAFILFLSSCLLEDPVLCPPHLFIIRMKGDSICHLPSG